MTSSVAITGLGVVAPNGWGAEEYWKSTLSAKHGISEITSFDSSKYSSNLAGLIKEFDRDKYVPSKLVAQTDVSTQYSLAAAKMALDDAAIDVDAIDDFGIGVVTSNASGGFEFTHREFQKLWTKGPEFVSVYESFAWFYAVNTGQISIRHGLRGPGSALVAEQAGGLDALGHARRTVRSGTPIVISGGVDSALDPWGWASHLSDGRVSRADTAERSYLPFDANANGHVPGEGGALLVIEDVGSARLRGASIYGLISGYASTFDPKPGSTRPSGLRRVVELALADAEVSPEDVDVVFADASGSCVLDQQEATVLSAVFGDYGVPVTAPKSLTGRMLSGGGPVDVAAAVLSIKDSVIPSSGLTTVLKPSHKIDLVIGEARAADVDTVLVLARGKWGFNSAVVVRKSS